MTQEIAVRVSQHVGAAADQAFDAWLNPALIGRWMFGPALRDEEVIRMTLDPQVGGAFSFVVRRAGQEIDHVGEYLEIDRPRRLAFTWGTTDSADRSRVVVEIAPLVSGCEVTLTHYLHPDWADYASRIEASWAKMLGALAHTLT